MAMHTNSIENELVTVKKLLTMNMVHFQEVNEANLSKMMNKLLSEVPHNLLLDQIILTALDQATMRLDDKLAMKLALKIRDHQISKWQRNPDASVDQRIKEAEFGLNFVLKKLYMISRNSMLNKNNHRFQYAIGGDGIRDAIRSATFYRTLHQSAQSPLQKKLVILIMISKANPCEVQDELVKSMGFANRDEAKSALSESLMQAFQTDKALLNQVVNTILPGHENTSVDDLMTLVKAVEKKIIETNYLSPATSSRW